MAFILTFFIGSVLLFQVQPMIAKFILPWYGGSPAVWSTCLLFFQVGLLLGYTYAHLLVRFLDKRKQVIVHCSLLVASLILLPVTPDESLKPGGKRTQLGVLSGC
jgi:predicted acyltransferase